jgi:sugar diacid utilization regulator
MSFSSLNWLYSCVSYKKNYEELSKKDEDYIDPSKIKVKEWVDKTQQFKASYLTEKNAMTLSQLSKEDKKFYALKLVRSIEKLPKISENLDSIVTELQKIAMESEQVQRYIQNGIVHNCSFDNKTSHALILNLDVYTVNP